MIIYSISFSIERTLEQEWLDWMKAHYLPVVQEKGPFHTQHFHILLKPQVDPMLVTYNLQLETETPEGLEEFEAGTVQKLGDKLLKQYPGRVVFFQTILKRIEI